MAETEAAERDLTVYAEKAPTDLQTRFAEWIPDQTGYNPNAAKSKVEAFNAGVKLATALRMVFQASPENQAALAESKARAEQAKADRAKAADEKPAKAEKAAPAKAPARKGAKAAAAEAPAPAKATKAAGRRPAKKGTAAAVATEEEAPF
jgi:hypothetical protein